MTKRILAAFVGLTTLLLAAVVVPLGAFTASHDRQVFLERAEASAVGVASRAEEGLSDHSSGGASAAGRAAIGDPGDQITILRSNGQRVVGLPTEVPVSPDQRLAVAGGTTVTRWLDDPDRLVVIVPISSNGKVGGLAALSRSTASLDAEIGRLWLGLTLAAVAALLTATALSLALARWVNRPLRRLERVAVSFGEGTLTARADSAAGPPELRELAVSFNRMAGRLESLLSGQRNAIADVSHQLRTPLAALRLRLELLGDATGASPEMDSALREVARLSHLVDGLLAVARAENTTPSPQAIDVAAVATERVDAWAPVALEGRVALELSAEPATAWATPGHVEQILDNLIANAIEVTPGDGCVRVAVTSGDPVRIQVADTGPGMTPVQRENALRRFWSEGRLGAAAHADRQGSGLGLAIADRLAGVDHGVLSLAEAPGGGLVASLELPAAKDRRVQPAR